MTDPMKQTRLMYESISSVDDANKVFGACKDGNSILLIHPGKSLLKPYITIPEGMYAIVQKNGKDMEYTAPDGSKTYIWPPGYHAASPLMRVSHLVTKQHVVFDTPVKGCKTADNVTATIDMSLLFRIMGDKDKGEDPELVRTFIYQLGPHGLEVQLRNAQEEAVRALARSVYHTEVYGLRAGTLKGRLDLGDLARDITQSSNNLNGYDDDDDDSSDEANTAQQEPYDMTNAKPLSPNVKGVEDEEGKVPEAEFLYYVTEDIRRILNKQFNRYGVEITDVAITNVGLPRTFEKKMEEKTTYQSIIHEQTMRQKNDMQLLRYKEELETKGQEKEMERLVELQEGQTRLAEVTKEINILEAETKQMLRSIDESKLISLEKISTDTKVELAKIRAEAETITAKIQAQWKADVSNIQAEKRALIAKFTSHVEQINAERDATVKKIIAEAEGIATKKLEKRRAYELDMKKADLMNALASNEHLVLSGESSSNTLVDMLVSQRKAKVVLNSNMDGISANVASNSSLVTPSVHVVAGNAA